MEWHWHRVNKGECQIHTWRPIVFIQPGMQDMYIIVCAFKVSVDWY